MIGFAMWDILIIFTDGDGYIGSRTGKIAYECNTKLGWFTADIRTDWR